MNVVQEWLQSSAKTPFPATESRRRHLAAALPGQGNLRVTVLGAWLALAEAVEGEVAGDEGDAGAALAVCRRGRGRRRRSAATTPNLDRCNQCRRQNCSGHLGLQVDVKLPEAM